MSEVPKPPKEEQSQKDVSIERVFLANDVLPDAAAALADRIDAIEDAIKTADIILDTNVLLLPYGAGANSLKEIIAVFKDLKGKGRLILPAQVAREFVKNRPNKLSELQQGIADKIGRYVGMERLSFPILEGVVEYEQINEAIKKNAELKKAHSALLKKIRSWEWNDPVNTAYREVFTTDIIIEPQFKREDTLAELLRRQKFLIPPGYKDSSKEDLGIGDFLIWKTILEIGAKNKKDIIFVSGDEKADWQHRAGGVGFLPRYELVDEFRRASAGSSFYIIPLSSLLELLQVKSTSVAEIKKEEARIQQTINVTVECPYCDVKFEWHLAEHLGASAAPFCSACGGKFHIHRTREGTTIHKPFERVTKEASEVALEKVVCPQCNKEVDAWLGIYPKATAWLSCANCEYQFPIHRKFDGSVMISSAKKPDNP